MYPRDAETELLRLARLFPVVSVTGPRQSGKTTLCRKVFADRPYVNLENPEVRDRVVRDPRGTLEALPDGAMFDEVQRAPELLSWLQVDVDANRVPGKWILSGSQNLHLSAAVAQSLAGRAATLTLLPLSAAELGRDALTEVGLLTALVRGGFPAIHAHGVPPSDWFAAWVATYVERDVRQLVNIGDLNTFRAFLGLVAGRAGQLVNLAALGADAGVSQPTARAWLSALEAGYVVDRLAPWHASLTSRLVKAPKVHLVDSGLHCWLLGIRSAEDLREHPLRGAIFEGWVVQEVRRARAHAGLVPDLNFVRDHRGHEVDLLVGRSLRRRVVEIKSGATVASDWFADLDRVGKLLASASPPVAAVPTLVYGGADSRRDRGVDVVSWRDVGLTRWAEG